MLNYKDLEFLVDLLNDEITQLCYYAETTEDEQNKKQYLLKLIEKVQNIKCNL